MSKKKGHGQYSKVKKEFKEKGVEFYGYPHRDHRVPGKKKKISVFSRVRQERKARDMDRQINSFT